jgi:F-box-like
MIFRQLEGADLRNCEEVCHQWRDILLAGTPWRRFFHRKVHYSHLWRKEQKKLEANQLTLPTEQYRHICKNLLQVERNWRMGQLKKSVCSVNADVSWKITKSDDFVAWNFTDFENDKMQRGCAFLDTESMKIKEITSCYLYQNVEEIVVRRGNFKNSVIEIRDPKNSWIVNVGDAEENDYLHRQISFGSGRLVEYTRNNFGTERMRIWKMENPSTLLQDRTFQDRNLKIHKVDEQFIVAWANNYQKPKADILYFISTETLEVFRSFKVNDYKWDYDRGLLFQYRYDGIVRILDLASGTYFNNVRLPVREEDERFVHLLWTWASSNSNVMVLGWKFKKEYYRRVSHLSVYDLEAVKKRNSDPGRYLLYTLQFQFDICSFVMDEKLIAFNGVHRSNNPSVIVLNFANFGFAEGKSSDLKENPEANEDVKMKIIYDRCVESV